MNRSELRKIIVTSLYQYQLLDLSLDELFENNLNYNLPERFKKDEEGNVYIHPVGKEESDYHFNDKEELEFVINVVTEAVNHEEEFIETINKRLSNWRYDRLGYMERAILLCALAELQLHTAKKSIVIDEAVELCKLYCDDEASGLINGVLDA